MTFTRKDQTIVSDGSYSKSLRKLSDICSFNPRFHRLLLFLKILDNVLAVLGGA